MKDYLLDCYRRRIVNLKQIFEVVLSAAGFIFLIFSLFLPVACRTFDRQSPSAAEPGIVEDDNVSIYDEEINAIIRLGRRGEWDQAEQNAAVLAVRDPDHPDVIRINEWVRRESRGRSEQALERKLYDFYHWDSRFDSTPWGLLLDPRRRGLPLSGTVRGVMEDFKRHPVVPQSYNQTIVRQQPLFDMNSRRGRMEELLEREVSIHTEELTLDAIIFTVGEAENINFVVDRSLPALESTLKVNLDQVTIREFFHYVSHNLGINFQIGEDIIWIVDGSGENSRMEETRFYRLRQGFLKPAQFGATEVTKVTTTQANVTTQTETQRMQSFVRDGAPPVPSLEQAIMQFFSGSDYMIDYERNIIVARGTREELRVLEQIIEEFDRPMQQVLIEARFLTVSEAAFFQLGLLWETGRDPAEDLRAPVDFTGFGTKIGLGLEEVFTNVLDRKNLTATLTALEQSGESETLSAPRLTVVNNLPATITDGKTQYYYEQYTVKQTILERRSSSTLVPLGRPTKLISGVELDVMPSIGGDGKSILLALGARVSQEVNLVTFAELRDRDEEGRLVSTFDLRLPESRDQVLATRVNVQSGNTIVMGGVMERERSTFVESVPILGNIPIIGAAFRKRTEVDKPRYLLIFVTATLLSDTGEFIAYDG